MDNVSTLWGRGLLRASSGLLHWWMSGLYEISMIKKVRAEVELRQQFVAVKRVDVGRRKMVKVR